MLIFLALKLFLHHKDRLSRHKYIREILDRHNIIDANEFSLSLSQLILGLFLMMTSHPLIKSMLKSHWCSTILDINTSQYILLCRQTC